eukprot:CAMPEP_0113314436 /NCGR_PEP_ID=MMETSP0010_2-20120614/10497_1 /TAXON_ID=216773 ORGANISM="Corethron hystrix, Strain 308" /NCGR_SAMPLE_ID=MMETSP0010_2 /ASSEMBLY_ACC=CAM_ASM_000155 /LENGTH=467 /DNA_ID=CAMNT_0000170721 /DNA_START=284 /DNA_END=1684 /DNA_ORIENTATION=+ /assembly_acc=CAM_ASM_000155
MEPLIRRRCRVALGPITNNSNSVSTGNKDEKTLQMYPSRSQITKKRAPVLRKRSKSGLLSGGALPSDCEPIPKSLKCDSAIEKENVNPLGLITKRLHSDEPSSSTESCLNEESIANSCQTQPQPSLSLKCFQPGAALGHGRFGNVYRAKTISKYASNATLPSSVALKILQKRRIVPPFCPKSKMRKLDGEFTVSFNKTLEIAYKSLLLLRREIEIQSRLRHPHILRSFGSFHDSTYIYMVLEEASGAGGNEGDLYKKMTRRRASGSGVGGDGRFCESEAAKYIGQLACALEYLSGIHVYHRDIKPENLLLDYKNQIKVSDFGWAVHAPPPNAHIRSTLCGTSEYLPPEMILEKAYDGTADIWSMGILAYELVAGLSPFQVSSEELHRYRKKKGRQKASSKDDVQMAVFAKLSKFEDGAVAESVLFGPESACKCDIDLTPNFKDFVSKILRRKGKDRLSATDVMVHSW